MKIDIEQGSPEWIALRKTKITATDAAIIMGNNPWKKRQCLLDLKRGLIEEDINEKMLAGQKLEGAARLEYESKFKRKMPPSVHVGCHNDYHYDWAMASIDGLSEDGKILLEIKCGKKSYEQACKDFIPDYYLDQVQHCLWITGAEVCHYMAYNEGKVPVYIQVSKNPEYIAKLIQKEYEFYMEMVGFYQEVSIT